MHVGHAIFHMPILYLRHNDYTTLGRLCSVLSVLSVSEVGPSLKRHFKLCVSTDPAVSYDVPAPLNSFNRIGPSPRQ